MKRGKSVSVIPSIVRPNMFGIYANCPSMLYTVIVAMSQLQVYMPGAKLTHNAVPSIYMMAYLNHVIYCIIFYNRLYITSQLCL